MVVELRHNGQKRPREDVLADKPVHGHLILDRGGAYLQSRIESPPTVGGMLPILCWPRVTRINRHGMVITGYYLVPGAGPNQPGIPQAWWCRPAT